jgi:hypothetical protein
MTDFGRSEWLEPWNGGFGGFGRWIGLDAGLGDGMTFGSGGGLGEALALGARGFVSICDWGVDSKFAGQRC